VSVTYIFTFTDQLGLFWHPICCVRALQWRCAVHSILTVSLTWKPCILLRPNFLPILKRIYCGTLCT